MPSKKNKTKDTVRAVAQKETLKSQGSLHSSRQGGERTPPSSYYLQRSMLFSGPLPHPEMLRQYEEIQPGTADRLLALLEKQTAHRINDEASRTECEIECQKKTTSGYLRRVAIGSWMAFTLALILEVVAAWLTNQGKYLPAGFFGAFGIAPIATAFLVAHNKNAKK